MALGSLVVKIVGDASSFNKTIASTQAQLNKSTKGLQTMAKSMTTVGDGMTKGVTVPLIAVGAILLKVGKDFDDAYDKIRIGTGATGKVLDGLKTDFKEVAKDSASSFADISTTIAGLNSRLGLTGKPLQELTTQMTNFARITESDINTLVPATTRVFGDWSIATKDQSKAMDTLFKVSQTTGISASTLAERVVELGAPLRNLGFSFAEATALMGKWEKEGVNTTTVFSGLRQALRVFAKEGVTDTKAALMDIIERMKNAGTAGEAATIGMAYFGKGLNDVVDTARGGKFDIAELVNTIEGSTDTINGAAAATDDWQEKLTKLKNEAMVNLEPIANKVFDSITRGVEKVTPKIEELTKWFGSLTTSQMDNLLKWGLILAAIGPVLLIVGKTTTGVIQLRNAILLMNAATKGILLPVAAFVALSGAVDIGSGKLEELNTVWGTIGATLLKSITPVVAIKDGLSDNIKVLKAYQDGLITFDEIAHVNYFTMGELVGRIDELRAAEEEANRVKEESTNLTEDQVAAENQLFDAGELGEAQMYRHISAQKASQTATEEDTGAIDEQTESVDDLRSAFNSLIESIFGGITTYNDFQEANWAVEAAQKALTEAIKKYGEGSQEAMQAQNDLDDSMIANIETAFKLSTQIGATTEAQEEARKKAIELGLQYVSTGAISVETFLNMASQFGMSSADIINYADEMGSKLDLETRMRIVAITADISDVESKIGSVARMLSDIDGRSASTTVTTWHQDKFGFKEGGPVGFSGGGLLDKILSASAGMNLPKFDSGGVLAMLHPPELVLNGKQALQVLWNQAQPQAKSGSKESIPVNVTVHTQNITNLDGKTLWQNNEKYTIRAQGERV